MLAKIMKNNNKIIGLIGGMGPFAGAEFCRLLFEKSSKNFGAVNSGDFPEVVLDSVPVRDFISDTKSLPDARRVLTERIKKLNKFGCNKIAMVCNTSHILFPLLSKVSAVEMISLINSVRDFVISNNLKRVGLLATKTSVKSNLFQNAFKSTGVEIVVPDPKTLNICEIVIRNVIANRISKKTVNKLVKNTNTFIKKQNLDGVILGCTELPLAFPKNTKLNIVNCLDVLSDKLLEDHYGKKLIAQQRSI